MRGILLVTRKERKDKGNSSYLISYCFFRLIASVYRLLREVCEDSISILSSGFCLYTSISWKYLCDGDYTTYRTYSKGLAIRPSRPTLGSSSDRISISYCSLIDQRVREWSSLVSVGLCARTSYCV